MRYYISDVFAVEKYSGNQLATFLDVDGLTGEIMQRIAQEVNYSETTFVLSHEPRDEAWPVRIFTPNSELDFAGHPTLGTADVIRRRLIDEPVEQVVLDLKVGRVPVRFSSEAGGDDRIWMDQIAPEFGEIFEPARMARVLGLEVDAIDGRWPIEEVSTGLPQIIVPLRSLDALRKIVIDHSAYHELIQAARAKVILAFSPEGYSTEERLGVRVFPIALGIAEDPATGSGNGCLAGWLIKHRYLDAADEISIMTGQGHEIGRPSRLSLEARRDGDRINIRVGGRVIPVAQGIWG